MLPKYTFDELLEKMDESQQNLKNMIENADSIPLEQLKKDAFRYFKQIIHKNPSDWYAKTDDHNDISLYTAAVQLQYFISLNSAAAFSIYLTRLEDEISKTSTKNKKDLLSIEAKKAISKQVKKEIAKYKRQKATVTS